MSALLPRGPLQGYIRRCGRGLLGACCGERDGTAVSVVSYMRCAGCDLRLDMKMAAHDQQTPRLTLHVIGHMKDASQAHDKKGRGKHT